MNEQEFDPMNDERPRDGQARAGYDAHVAWERIRGSQNECDEELRIREEQPECDGSWWDGWFLRSDSWRAEIGHEVDAEEDDGDDAPSHWSDGQILLLPWKVE
jgi:hypothetical protein